MIVVLLRLLYYFTMSTIIIVLISGCFGKSSSNIVRVSGFGSAVIVKDFDSKLQHTQWKGVSVNNDCSSNLFNKNHMINNTSRYDYNYINRGSYSSCCYKVKPGDTLFYIAWITGVDYRILAKRNNIAINSVLKIGQILQVDIDKQSLNNKLKIRNIKNDIVKKKLNTCSVLEICKLDNVDFNSTNSNKSHFLDKGSINLLSSSQKDVHNINNISDKTNTISNYSKMMSEKIIIKENEKNIQNNKRTSSIFWCWPTEGKIISNFSSSEGGNRGIDISGMAGQSIFSASSGKVVYVGDALFGYGNLIIIKHNNDFLSTYAHNDKILVSERQNVFLGQKIATMGSSGADVIKLHFEIRYQGKSVDPLYYLPKR